MIKYQPLSSKENRNIPKIRPEDTTPGLADFHKYKKSFEKLQMSNNLFRYEQWKITTTLEKDYFYTTGSQRLLHIVYIWLFLDWIMIF